MAEGPTHLVQLLENAASTNAGISIYPSKSSPVKYNRLTYNEFLKRAHHHAQSIHNIPGITKDSVVLLHFDNHTDNLDWFWAVTLAGYTPAVSTPLVTDHDQRKKHLLHLHTLLKDPIVLTTSALIPEFLELDELRLHPIEGLKAGPKVIDAVNEGDSSSTAVLMLTSGSTGNAKAVCLRHDQIITSVEGKHRHLGLASDDVFLNWIGMDHVANLIEMHLHAMYLAAEQVHVQASDLLMEPLSFLSLIDKYRVSYAFSPNFFLASLKRAISGLDTRTTSIDFDLSCLKILMCGGEANVIANLVELTQVLKKFGVEDGFLRPAFGMTETCAASMYGQNCPSYEVERSLEFSTVGTCIPGIKMRIMKDEGDQKFSRNEAPNGEIGNFQMTGPIVTREYFNNPEATESSFTWDGWFITGDKGYIDDQGNLILTGRSKETLIVNGVKHFPHEIESAIDEGFISGVSPSFTAVFPHRPSGSQTEELCVVYLPSYELSDAKAHTQTMDAITQVCLMIANTRPYRIIPLPKAHLSKSALGKLSRAKLRSAFEAGTFDEYETESSAVIKAYRLTKQEAPTTELEERITDIFCDMFELPREDAWVGSSLFDFGVTSIELIGFKQRVQNQLTAGQDLPVVMLMQNPTIRGMAEVIQLVKSGPKEYNPVVTLQSKGDKTPLWFVHPVSGEVLVYVSLVKYLIDRPLHALRARGLETSEDVFTSMKEAVETYYSHMKKTQPEGPYAIAGYSEGALIAYEIAKLVEANGDKIVFCGLLDTTPKVSPLTGGRLFSRIDLLTHLSYLIELTTREHALSVEAELGRGTFEEAVAYFLGIAPPGRIQELDLNEAKLHTEVDVMDSLWKMLIGYDLKGEVSTLDVFVARESGLVDQEVWEKEHLQAWNDHSKAKVEFYTCEGKHHSMLTPANVVSFQRALRQALKAKGI